MRATTTTGRIGAAVASKFLAVGARNVFVRTGVGAIVSQAMFNPYYGPRGLALLAAGASAADAVRLLTAADEGRHLRQLHVHGSPRASSPPTPARDCTAWCGHLCKPAFSRRRQHPGRCRRAGGRWPPPTRPRPTLPFARRLIAAMQAGEAAGGDSRGRQSAALLVHDEEDYSLLDLRADDHADPLAEIARLEEIARQSWVHFRRVLPSAGNPNGVLDRAEIGARIAASIAEGYE